MTRLTASLALLKQVVHQVGILLVVFDDQNEFASYIVLGSPDLPPAKWPRRSVWELTLQTLVSVPTLAPLRRDYLYAIRNISRQDAKLAKAHPPHLYFNS